jgi:hypothetical protein
MNFQNLPIDIYNYIADYLPHKHLIYLIIAWPKLKYYIWPNLYNFKNIFARHLQKYIKSKDQCDELIKITKNFELYGEMILDLFYGKNDKQNNNNKHMIKSASYNLIINVYSHNFNNLIEFMHNNFNYISGGCGILYFNIKDTNLIIHIKYHKDNNKKYIVYKNNKLKKC